MSATSPHSSRRANVTADDWRRGFADPDVEDEDPPARRPASNRAPEPGPGAFTGADDSGAIAVAVDRAGVVADVTVARNWRDVITPPALGHALHTAADNAIRALVAGQTEHLDLDSVVVEMPTAPPAAPAFDESTLTEMVDLLNRAGRDLETFQAQAESVLTATATAAGPNNKVTVSLARGRVAEVTADPRWASHVRYTEIQSESLGAFRAARRQLGNTDIASFQKPASLVRLQELVDRIARPRDLS
jgi:hypothetical protein